jgi:hypothetical protein
VYNIELSQIDYILAQLGFIFTSKDVKISRGQITCLAYFILHKDFKKAVAEILKDKIRYSKKTIENDIADFRKLGIMDKSSHKINEKINVCLLEKSFLINYKVI